MDSHLRQSNFSHSSTDLEQDRRLINQKLQLRRSKQKNNYPDEDEEEEDQSVLDYYNRHTTTNNYYDSYDGDLDFDNGDMDQNYLLRQAHEQDEQMIGGKVTAVDNNNDGDGNNNLPNNTNNDGLEAMNQALATMPAAWWAKRKQWQPKKPLMGISSRGGMRMASIRSSNVADPEGEAMNMMMMEEEEQDDHPNGDGGGEMEEGALGHPVMLTDPTTLGYDTDAFRQANNTNGAYRASSIIRNGKVKRGPTILYVSRAEIKRRRMQQMGYIVSALSVIFLFMFCLEQLKLAQYAMVESPVPLHAYLAGEVRQGQEDAGNNPNKVTLGSLGLQQFDGNIDGIPVVEFGKIQLERDDPLTETAAQGGGTTSDEEEQQQSAGILHAADYFEILKGVITGWGITPAEIFDNEESPQYKALHWMAYEDILRRAPDTDFQIKKIIQRYALSVIYFATAGELWRDSALFLSNLDECSWNMKREPKYFLGAGACEEGFVTRLDLWGNHLTGALPPEIGSLHSLQSISVFDNNMRGPPPKSMVHLKQLKKLYLQKNDFQGDVDFLCVIGMKLFKSDCGKRGGVTCSCCSGCGYNANNDKPIG